MPEGRKNSKLPEHSPAPTPDRAVYGFVLYLLSYSALVLYLTWALLPERTLVELGLEFLPQKYWAVAVPTYISVVLVAFVVCIYPNLGAVMAPADDGTHMDEFSVYWDGEAPTGAVPPVADIPPHLVPEEVDD